MSTTPQPDIDDLALVGDGRCAAIFNREGALVWLCWPAFDSPAAFASLLGGVNNGEWRIAPSGPHKSVRRYRPETLILETQFETSTGNALLIDFMPHMAPALTLVRRLRGLSGQTQMTKRFAPRFNYGREYPRYRCDGGVAAEGASFSLALRSSHSDFLRGDDDVSFVLREGETVDFVMTEAGAEPGNPAAAAEKAERDCEAFWRAWCARCAYDGPWRALVLRSLITLKAMIYAPSGGIVAAPTSSLPDEIGGARNWDYRFCWLRDSVFTVLALLHAGYHEEAEAWVKWLVERTRAEPRRLKVLYGVRPGKTQDEFEADWFSGFAGSRPVRFGNAARDEDQLGGFGDVQDALHQWRVASGRPEISAWAHQRLMLDELDTIVDKPDSGIWEIRSRTRFFTQSRVMAWVAYDRAERSARKFGLVGDPGWRGRAEALHAQVCERGYEETLGAFTRAYGSHSLDASNLLLPLVGFLPASDPRIVGTLKAVREKLGEGSFLRRYDPESGDNAQGHDGAFLACSYWMADNLVLMGRRDEAARIFEDVAGAANDLGLLSEEYDVSAKRQLGNFPQGLSHLGVVHTAFNLSGRGPAHSRSSNDI